MKNIYLTALLVLSMSFTGCEDFLTTDPVGGLTLEQAKTTPTAKSVEMSVSSSYQMLSNTLNLLSSWGWSDGLVFNNNFVLQDLASDDMEKKWIPDGDQSWMDEVNNFTFTSTNGGPNGVWKYNYESIKRVNIALGYLLDPTIEAVTGLSTERKNQLLGEIYFLRSFYYFSLVNFFGNVPIILKPIQSYQEAFDLAIRKPKEEVWAQIKSDLELSISLLPNSKYSSEKEKWRVSKGAAIALLAKTYLYNNEWANVITKVSELEGLGFYSLNANYFDSFSVKKEFAENEVIFCYDHQTKQDPNRGNGLCSVTSWGFIAPSDNFTASFEENDPRKEYTVNSTAVSTDNPRRWINKLLGSVDGANDGNDDSPSNVIYIRWADVLLWKAEALIEAGDYTGAINIINKIRERARNTVTTITVRVPDPSDATKTILETTVGSPPPAGTLPDRPSSADKAEIKNWLIAERRTELGFESHRMNDLKRWGIAKDVMTKHGKVFQDKHLLWPVPQSEIDASGKTLTQNSGY